MQLDILAFGAHPDDVELGCAGILAKEAQAGKNIGIIDLTTGELGTRGTPELRLQEAAHAAQIMQIAIRENLFMRDGFFVNDEAHQLKVIQMIRKYRPKIVIANAIDDRHIDHPKGSALVSDSCFLSGLAKIETFDEQGNSQAAWRPSAVYHYIQWMDIKPDFVVDISGFMDVKKEAILAYSSQFYNPDSKEPITPIATKNFLDSVLYRSQDLGRLVGVDHAEGFTVERYPAVDSLFDLL
ncbi:MAG: bacillithiol biosynthesis deacetylase BshB1 [Flavobacterium sp. BFFFF2]|nr:MAG: bacillithiol biosynthesis deacetylase BshB1 [Flavobacterium sp. BFFFF2]